MNKAFHSFLHSDLIDGPDNGWLGYYSLTQQNKTDHLQMSFADYLDENKPVTFTDPAVRCCATKLDFITLYLIK